MSSFNWSGWKNRRQWPIDPPGFMFLGRAFELLGRARFPEDWTGQELIDAQEDLPPRVPSVEEAFPRGERATGVQAHYGPYVNAALGDFRTGPISEEDWASVYRRVERERLRIISAQYRLSDLAEVCVKLAQRGELNFASRPKLRGGIPVLIRPADWYIDYPLNPFSTLGTDGDSGFGLCSPEPAEWLFVTEESLGTAIESGAVCQESPPSLDRPRVRARTYSMLVGSPLPPASLINDNGNTNVALAGSPAEPAEPGRERSNAPTAPSAVESRPVKAAPPPTRRRSKSGPKRIPQAIRSECRRIFKYSSSKMAALDSRSRTTLVASLWSNPSVDGRDLDPPVRTTVERYWSEWWAETH